MSRYLARQHAQLRNGDAEKSIARSVFARCGLEEPLVDVRARSGRAKLSDVAPDRAQRTFFSIHNPPRFRLFHPTRCTSSPPLHLLHLKRRQPFQCLDLVRAMNLCAIDRPMKYLDRAVVKATNRRGSANAVLSPVRERKPRRVARARMRAINQLRSRARALVASFRADAFDAEQRLEILPGRVRRFSAEFSNRCSRVDVDLREQLMPRRQSQIRGRARSRASSSRAESFAASSALARRTSRAFARHEIQCVRRGRRRAPLHAALATKLVTCSESQ